MNRDVSRFALGVAALVFGSFVLFLVGVASFRETLNQNYGPFSLGVWLLLIIHLCPVVFGIVHMKRSGASDLVADSQSVKHNADHAR